MKQHNAGFKKVSWVMVASLLSLHTYADAAESESETDTQSPPQQLEEITVYGDSVNSGFLTPLDANAPGTSESFTEKSINLFGTEGNINVLKVVEMAPSVNYSPVDFLGTNESSFHDAIRIRGKKQTGPGNLKSYEGIPICGNPGGGKTIFDMENIESVDLYKGYMPVDKGLGFSNIAGKLDMTTKRPQNTFGADFSQTFGSDSFSRTFLRLDSGDFGKVSAFGSLSETLSDKYKGRGDLERTNGSLGLVGNPSDKFKAELFVTHNTDDHHNYYNLTYQETQDLGTNFDKDFSNDKTSSNYYDYNKQNFEDTAVVANFEGAITDDSIISFKPYYLTDSGQYSYASKQNVIKWDIDHELFGGVLKYEKNFSKEINAKLGYWAHNQEPPGPPTAQKKYTVGANGLQFAGYAVLADNDDHEIQSPFTEVNGQIGNFVYSGGVRYLYLKLGSLRSYTNGTTAATSEDYNTAIANGTLDTWASVDEKIFREWLPSGYLGYNFSGNATLYVDYTRTYGLDVNLFPTYVQQRSVFVSNGVSLEDLWADLKLETSDNFDLGLKYKVNEHLVLNPNAFLSVVENKQARIYDATYNVTYPYNGADALGYGLELPVSGTITRDLEYFVALSYNKYYFTDDLQTASNTTISSDGNQVPDAPEYMAKGALSYRIYNFEITPSVRYLSKRYGDVLNKEEVDDCTLVDLDVSYTLTDVRFVKSIEFRVTATNLLDKEYISTINTADDALAATTNSATYQTGAPFSIFANISFLF